MARICYEIKSSEAGWNPLYQQSYLGEIGWNEEMLKRVSDSLIATDKFGQKVFSGELYESVIDSIEKLGMLYLGREMLNQEIRNFTGLSQILLKFHLYHWLYDSIACLDSLARVLNARFELRVARRSVSLNRRFINNLSAKNTELTQSLEKEFEWIDDLKSMRSTVIHREGRLITDGGREPCFVWDFKRAFEPNVDLSRVKLPDLVDEFMVKIDALCLKVISSVPSKQKMEGV
ncbi:MAG: hypothetical protein WAS24_05180 [Thermoplasmata archaeon]